MRGLLFLGALLLAAPAAAETLVAARTIRAQTVILPADLALDPGDMPDTLTRPAQAIGFEARVTLYPGRPIRAADIGPAAIIERNQIVPLVFARGGLVISAEGRALGRAGPGDRLRVINTLSRSTVTGTVRADGSVSVP